MYDFISHLLRKVVISGAMRGVGEVTDRLGTGRVPPEARWATVQLPDKSACRSDDAVMLKLVKLELLHTRKDLGTHAAFKYVRQRHCRHGDITGDHNIGLPVHANRLDSPSTGTHALLNGPDP